MPERGYFLYTGPVEAVTAVLSLAEAEQTPNLWWPSDHAWCVASEIDLAWTYVGGPQEMIGQLLADERIEVVPAKPGDRPGPTEDWLVGLVGAAMDELWMNGECTITTSRGTVQAWLTKPGRFRRGSLRTEHVGENNVWGSSALPLGRRSEEDLRAELEFSLTEQVIGLVGR
jgi:hypothetical protein